MSSTEAEADRGQHIAKQARQQHRDTVRAALREWGDLLHKAIAADRADLVHAILDERVLPHVRLAEDRIRSVQAATRARDGLDFDRRALLDYATSRDGAAAVAVTPGVDPDDIGLSDLEVSESEPPVSSDVLLAAARSIYALLAASGIVDTQATSAVAATEYRHQVAERYYSALSAGSSEVSMIDPDDDLKATLFAGGQGSGKSTALETVVEDRVAHGHKVIDLLDFLKAENCMYDVPPRDIDLQKVRAGMGLDVGFQQWDPPTVRVLAPLTDELEDLEVPYDTDADEHVVQPFCIPASDLTYRQLVMVLPHTTRTQENYLKSAHQMLSKRGTDWTLADVARTVREETNAGDAVADRIERSLETAQQKSFIRDCEVEENLLLDWESLMQDTDTVHAFTAATLSETSDRLLIASYLLDQLFESRRQLLAKQELWEYPPLTTVMRELHKVVPRSKSEQDAESTIEGYMIDTMADLIALVRHANMEIVADTQKFKQQLDDDISGLFHRIFAFGGQKPDIKKIFKTRIDDSRPAEKVSQYDTGEAALVSGEGYRMPLQFAPPRCHHLDARTDGHGFGMRTRHPCTPDEAVDAPWDTSIPPRLRFDDVDSGPVAEFWYECVREDRNADMIPKDEVAQAYQDWAEEHGRPTRSVRQVKAWIGRNQDVETMRTTKVTEGDSQTPVYRGIRLLR